MYCLRFWTICVWFMMGKVILGQVFLRLFRFSFVSIILTTHMHCCCHRKVKRAKVGNLSKSNHFQKSRSIKKKILVSVNIQNVWRYFKELYSGMVCKLQSVLCSCLWAYPTPPPMIPFLWSLTNFCLTWRSSMLLMRSLHTQKSKSSPIPDSEGVWRSRGTF